MPRKNFRAWLEITNKGVPNMEVRLEVWEGQVLQANWLPASYRLMKVEADEPLKVFIDGSVSLVPPLTKLCIIIYSHHTEVSSPDPFYLSEKLPMKFDDCHLSVKLA